MFVPEAKVVHHKGVSSTHRLTVEYYKHLGMMRFYRKLLGQTRPRWFLTLLAAATWTRFGGIAAIQLISAELSGYVICAGDVLDWQRRTRPRTV